MNLPDRVLLREVVTRDGFQSLDNFIPTRTKIKIINKILAAGVSEIEVTSFVSSKSIPQLRDASDLMTFLLKDKVDVIYSALVPNLLGAKSAVASGVNKLVSVMSASESHNQANIKRSMGHSISELSGLFDFAIDNNTSVVGSIAVAFGCPYEGKIKISDVLRIAEIYFSLGADSLILADTIGMATPPCVVSMVNSFQNEFPDKFLTLHFHNNSGTAMANLVAALESGITSFDTSLGGIGGCPYVPSADGNLSTEDVVDMLEKMDIYTGINLEKIIDAAEFLDQVLK